ncbi:Uu.00g116880.m01.CDS01 [Anthostomella pinea]|uniref:non-specific serine/threonine protein kinase n=1 Tax=Anthostomella pinea TaxID=933095 RepID=A0AAI8VG33_9PEZI|nr:Uu.00g116880.m01.CDS01 [Anthostomella pinea]
MAEAEYEVMEKIGHGSFGVIRKVRRKVDGMVLCRKEISYLKMSQKEREQLHAEFHILSSLHHPNIVGYFHREHLKQSQDLHLYMEYCGNGDLGRMIRNLTRDNKYAEEHFVWEVFSQLVTALYRCHYGKAPPEVGQNVLGTGVPPKSKPTPGSMTILHRDLKPENVFLGENNSVKLGDFGLSKMIQSHDFASTYVGTPFYMSPEICAAERYTLKSDIWSLGCVMYELCAREPPFNAKSHFQLVQKIKEGRVATLPRVYSSELMVVIRDCLKVNPDSRPDTATLLNLPVVRLMRMQREAVDLKSQLDAKLGALDRKLREADKKLASIDADKAYARQEIESSLRREWEVKARLEIDRLVNDEIESLQKRFEGEVQARVQEELQKKSVTFGDVETQEFTSSAKSEYPQSVAGADTDGEFPSTTDITEFSVDSPEEAPLKKSSRAPFGRAQTMFERNFGTPMDVDMASPLPIAPIAIASLSLSPRRNNATKAPLANAPTIFDEVEEDARWKTTRDMDPVLSESDEDDDDTPVIPSPTRPPRSNKNPFGPQRPVLTSMKTAPVNRLKTQASSTGTNKPMPPLPSATHSVPDLSLRPQPSNGALRERSNSPNRRMSKIPSAANLLPLPSSGENNGLQRKPSLTKKDPESTLAKVAVKNNVRGRTLVELQQARAGGRPVSVVENGNGANFSPRRGASFKDRCFVGEPAVWDPERDEMPSPFLVRRKPVLVSRTM